jgi:hypothetical protein
MAIPFVAVLVLAVAIVGTVIDVQILNSYSSTAIAKGIALTTHELPTHQLHGAARATPSPPVSRLSRI